MGVPGSIWERRIQVLLGGYSIRKRWKSTGERWKRVLEGGRQIARQIARQRRREKERQKKRDRDRQSEAKNK